MKAGFWNKTTINNKMYDLIKRLMAFDQTYRTFVINTYNSKSGNLRGLNNSYVSLKRIFNNIKTEQTYEVLRSLPIGQRESESIKPFSLHVQSSSSKQCSDTKKESLRRRVRTDSVDRGACSSKLPVEVLPVSPDFEKRVESVVGASSGEHGRDGEKSARVKGASEDRKILEQIYERLESEVRGIDLKLEERARESGERARESEERARESEERARESEERARESEERTRIRNIEHARYLEKRLQFEIDAENREHVELIKDTIDSIYEAPTYDCHVEYFLTGRIRYDLDNKACLLTLAHHLETTNKKLGKRATVVKQMIRDWYSNNKDAINKNRVSVNRLPMT